MPPLPSSLYTPDICGRRLRCCHEDLTDEDLRVVDKGVGWDLEVEGRRALSDATRGVVVRAVARAEPAAKVTRAVDRHASKVCSERWQ